MAAFTIQEGYDMEKDTAVSLTSDVSSYQHDDHNRWVPAGRSRAPSWMTHGEGVPASLIRSVPFEDPTAHTALETPLKTKRSRAGSMDVSRRRSKSPEPPMSVITPSLQKKIRVPRFIESLGLTGKMKPFVVIEIFQGHQVIKHWQCNDFVYYVNDIVDSYRMPPKTQKQEAQLLDLLNRYLQDTKSPMDTTPAPGSTAKIPPGSISKHSDHQEGGEAANGAINNHYHNHYHQHFHSRPGANDNKKRSTTAQHTDASVGRLAYRDLRQVLTEGSPGASIEVRKNCIILCLPPLSCLILADRVFLIVVEDLKMDGLLASLEAVQLSHLARPNNHTDPIDIDVAKEGSKYAQPLSEGQDLEVPRYTTVSGDVAQRIPLSQRLKGDWEQRQFAFPLEYECLELAMSAAFEQLDEDINRLECQYQDFNSDNKNAFPTFEGGEQLFSIKNLIRTFTDRVSMFDRAISGILSSPEELIHMELTRQKDQAQLAVALQLGPAGNAGDSSTEVSSITSVPKTAVQGDPRVEALRSLWENSGESPDPDLEILMEFFDQEIQMFRQRTSALKERINERERLTGFKLNLGRNKLLRWAVGSGMLGAAMGLTTSMSSIFGMNMLSTWEESIVGFWTVTGAIIALSILSAIAVYLMITKVKL